MSKSKKTFMVLGFIVAVFLVWRTILSWVPQESRAEHADLHDAEKSEKQVADMEKSLEKLDLRFSDLQNQFNSVIDASEEKDKTFVATKDVARAEDLSRRYLTLRDRVDAELKDVRMLTGALRDVAGKAGDGKRYEVQIENNQKLVDAKLAAFESENLQLRSLVHDRIDQWSGTLNMFAAILAIIMTAISGLAGLVLYLEIQPRKNP